MWAQLDHTIFTEEFCVTFLGNWRFARTFSLRALKYFSGFWEALVSVGSSSLILIGLAVYSEVIGDFI